MDGLIILLLTWVLLIDTINGFFKLNFTDLDLPISQLYKLLVIALVCLRLLVKKQFIFLFPALILLLIAPTLGQIVMGNSPDLVADITKTIKYLTPVLFYIYFSSLFREGTAGLDKWLTRFILISFLILASNILLKWFGLGFPLYKGGQLGSKGFFYAGNEISGLLLILYAIMAYNLNLKKKQVAYWLFFAFNLYLAFYLGSKTAIGGILIIAFLLKIDLIKILSSAKRFSELLVTILIVLPVILVLAYQYFISSEIFQKRILFFSEKFDLTTLILSQRNIYLEEAFARFSNEYNFIEKWIGVGFSSYMENVRKSVEMDLFDILFTHGIIGLMIFATLITWVFMYSYRNLQSPRFMHARLTFVMGILLLLISTLVGHTFSSGMAGIFIGYIFALGHKRS